MIFGIFDYGFGFIWALMILSFFISYGIGIMIDYNPYTNNKNANESHLIKIKRRLKRHLPSSIIFSVLVALIFNFILPEPSKDFIKKCDEYFYSASHSEIINLKWKLKNIPENQIGDKVEEINKIYQIEKLIASCNKAHRKHYIYQNRWNIGHIDNFKLTLTNTHGEITYQDKYKNFQLSKSDYLNDTVDNN